MREFSLTIANRPGQLATLARSLADAGVNIEALAAMAVDGESQVRLMVDDADAGRRVLRELDIHFEERPVLDTFLPNTPGSLAELADVLGEADVNIDSIYLLHSNAEGLHMAVTVDDPETARSHLASG